MRICIVGGGISGLAAAHYLTDTTGHDVTILEAAAVLGGRANVTGDGEHCTRVFLDDYHYLNDLLVDIPTVGGRSLLDQLLPAERYARARDGRWVRIDHIYAFLSRASGLTLRDKMNILTSNRRSLLAAIDADRWKRREDSPGSRRWTLRLPSANPQPDITSTNRYGSLWNWTPAGLYRALRSAWRSSAAVVLGGCTERHLLRPWVEFLHGRGVTVQTNHRVDRIEAGADSVRVTVAGVTESYELVLIATFAHDAYQLLDRSSVPRPLDHRTHTHFKALTIGLDAREPVLAGRRSQIYASDGITTIVQPNDNRCVCMAAYPRSTDREFLLGILREQLSLRHDPRYVLERDNLEPGEAVFVGDYVDPTVLAAPLGGRVQFAGSCMDNSYPVDSAEGACRSAYNAIARFAHHHHRSVSVRPQPPKGGPPTRSRLFPSTARPRAHPNAPASAAISARLWRTGQRMSSVIFLLTARVRIDASGTDWPLDRPAVYVSTHRSLLDTPLGLSVFRRLAVQPRPVVAARYFNHPLGCLLRGVGALVAVRRSDATITAAVAALRSGDAVAFMVEGRLVDRREASAVAHGRGAVETALRARAPIVPIAAAGAGRVWPPGAERPIVRLRRPVVTVLVGPPIEPTGLQHELMLRVREALHALEAQANDGPTIDRGPGRWRRSRVRVSHAG